MWSIVKPNLPMIIGMVIAGATFNVIALAVLVCLVLIPARHEAPAASRPLKVPALLKNFWFQIAVLFGIAMIAMPNH